MKLSMWENECWQAVLNYCQIHIWHSFFYIKVNINLGITVVFSTVVLKHWCSWGSQEYNTLLRWNCITTITSLSVLHSLAKTMMEKMFRFQDWQLHTWTWWTWSIEKSLLKHVLNIGMEDSWIINWLFWFGAWSPRSSESSVPLGDWLTKKKQPRHVYFSVTKEKMHFPP